MMLSPPPRRPLRRSFLPAQDGPSPSVQILHAVEPLGRKCSSVLARWKQAHSRWLVAAAALTALLSVSLPAWASLGGHASSVESDRAQMNASVQVTSHDSYEVHEVQAPGGTVVDE